MEFKEVDETVLGSQLSTALKRVRDAQTASLARSRSRKHLWFTVPFNTIMSIALIALPVLLISLRVSPIIGICILLWVGINVLGAVSFLTESAESKKEIAITRTRSNEFGDVFFLLIIRRFLFLYRDMFCAGENISFRAVTVGESVSYGIDIMQDERTPFFLALHRQIEKWNAVTTKLRRTQAFASENMGNDLDDETVAAFQEEARKLESLIRIAHTILSEGPLGTRPRRGQNTDDPNNILIEDISGLRQEIDRLAADTERLRAAAEIRNLHRQRS